ncbi:MAG: coenzyme F420-0:L-glutamate ligase [Chloroflexota bacterium]|nr:coenzyme F420-0:L-glutamate ligase [Chloroflexota bacterium]
MTRPAKTRRTKNAACRSIGSPPRALVAQASCHTPRVRRLSLWSVDGLPEIRPGDDLAGLIATGLGEPLHDRDVVVVAQKIVSKAEGRVVALSTVTPSERALKMAAESGKDARQLEVVLRETRTIVRWERGVLISETHHGFVCANAGVDRSNAGAADSVVLLPVDPDGSAARLREDLVRRTGCDVAVVVTDTFGRPWREGHVNVAIGMAGLPALLRYMGQYDPQGYELRVTEIAVADEIAAAAELVMGKLDRHPVAIVRGLEPPESTETAHDYVRPKEKDMFR